MITNVRFGFALEYVADVEAAKQFYIDVLGLEVDREHPTFVQFKDPAGTSYAIASDESLGGSRGTELYWIVDDAQVAFDELRGRAEVSFPLRHLPFGQVFGVKDPAGQTQFLIEFAKVRPSRRVG